MRTLAEESACLAATYSANLNRLYHTLDNRITALATRKSEVLVDDYVQPTDPTYNGYPDITNALIRAFAVSDLVFGTPGSIYYVNNAVLNGRVFDGRNCILRDAPGCKWGIKTTGYRAGLVNFTFQDQANYVTSTTLAAAATAGAMTIQVTSAGNIATGDVIFILTSSNEIRWQTYVTAVSGTTVTIRDPLSDNAASGALVESMLAAIVTTQADQWYWSNIQAVNGAGSFLVMPDVANGISNRGSINNISSDSFRCFGFLKAGNAAGIKADNVKLWGGISRPFTYNGTGTAGPYSFQYLVYLLRDVTVTVNGVPKVYGTDWTYAGATSIQFLAGHYPNIGDAVQVTIYKCAYRGFVSDQRQANIISGGNTFTKVETLGCMLGTTVFAGDLTEVANMIADSCQYAALTLDTCNSETLAFTGQTFLGFSGTSLKMFNSTGLIDHLYPQQVPQPYSYTTVSDKIYIDSTSHLKVGRWTGDRGATVASGGRISVLDAEIIKARNGTDIAAASTVYLSSGGVVATNFRDAADRTSEDGYLVKMRVDTDTAPGDGQSFTYNVLALVGTSLTTIGTATLSGGSAFNTVVFQNYYLPEGTEIGVQLVTSASAPSGARHIVKLYVE